MKHLTLITALTLTLLAAPIQESHGGFGVATAAALNGVLFGEKYVDAEKTKGLAVAGLATMVVGLVTIAGHDSGDLLHTTGKVFFFLPQDVEPMENQIGESFSFLLGSDRAGLADLMTEKMDDGITYSGYTTQHPTLGTLHWGEINLTETELSETVDLANYTRAQIQRLEGGLY